MTSSLHTSNYIASTINDDGNYRNIMKRNGFQRTDHWQQICYTEKHTLKFATVGQFF